MSNKINIQGFGGARSAEIEYQAGKITLLVGRNGQGKTSTLRGAGHLLSQTKPDKALINWDSGEATLAHIGADHSYSIVASAKDVKVYNAEDVRPINKISAGLVRFTALKPAERAAMLIPVLGARPTEDELFAQVAPVVKWDQKSEQFQKLWKDISLLGWDAATKQYDENRLVLQRQWCQLTNNRAFQSEKGAEWKPEGWQDGLDVAALKTQREDLIAQYGQVIKVIVVDENRRKELKEKIAGLSTFEDQAKEKQAAVDSAATALNMAKSQLQSNPAPGAVEPEVACPHCANHVVIRGGQLHKPRTDKLTKDQAAKLAKANTDALAAVTAAQAKCAQAENALLAAKQALAGAKAAQTQLDQMPAPTEASDGPGPDEIIAEQRRVESLISMVEKRAAAQTTHAQALQTGALQDVLKPEGLRQTKLAEKMDAFNLSLRRLSEAAKWPCTFVDASMGVEFGRAPYEYASESEQWRADLIIQIALAQYLGDAVVVADRSDVLYKDIRANFVSMLAKSAKVAVIVAMTATPGDVPDLEKAGLGWVYQIENGALLVPARA